MAGIIFSGDMRGGKNSSQGTGVCDPRSLEDDAFRGPRRNPAEWLRWGEEGQRSGVQKAFSRRAF